MEERGSFLIEPVREIGSGGNGTVELINLYNLSHFLCGQYARKFLDSDGTEPDLWERFKREVECQGKCVHKYVVQIFICNLQAARPWFVMELAESNLQQEINSGTLSDEDKLKIINMVLEGLASIHKRGYLHRDIKPLNILKFPTGEYKLSDFGLAKSLNPTREQFATKIGIFHGTERYFDYGIFVHGYSWQSDIYSIGILMEDLYVDGLDDIINKCKHSQLKKRYTNVEQIITAIKLLEAKTQ
ncbi:protein kinase domain-containing protein [Rahnella aceris]|uniref:protein kinase domain-containing protein n=1 Tax=Rahnella sp. (strain Y9602) TaxID=2703885 RepID=UPI001F52DE63|nr:protein kinase [Rahnella aceris]UNK55641.1 protein kinase [Rahnella aceris]